MDKIKCGYISCILTNVETGEERKLEAFLKTGFSLDDLSAFSLVEETIMKYYNDVDSGYYIDSTSLDPLGVIWNKDDISCYLILEENEMGRLVWHECKYPEIPDFLK